MRYLGIDYGLKKMGLALSEGQLSSPLKVVQISSFKDALEKVDKVIKDEEIERVVVGVPESGTAAKIVRNLISQLKEKYLERAVEVIEAEETLSSLEARELMIEMDVPQKSRKSEEDAYAAVLILQRFLNSLN